MALAKKQRDGAGPALGPASRLCLRPGCQAHAAGPRRRLTYAGRWPARPPVSPCSPVPLSDSQHSSGQGLGDQPGQGFEHAAAPDTAPTGLGCPEWALAATPPVGARRGTLT